MNSSRLHDRYLERRGDRWHYVRRVPSQVGGLDSRGHIVRLSLRTADLAVARIMRDAMERADNDLWASLLCQHDADAAMKAYTAAVLRAQALGFSYRPAAELATQATFRELAERMDAIQDVRTPYVAAKAVLGGQEQPAVLISQALKVYFDDISAPRMVTKSVKQRRKWQVIPERSVRSFIEVNGDVAIGEINREHAQRFYRHWRARIAPAGKDAVPTHTASSGNRELGALRTLYSEYYAFMGASDRPNPFAGLYFEERQKAKRPPFPVSWLTEKLLKGNALHRLNLEARALLLAVMETGARPSELCNLRGPDIHVDAAIPHIRIAEYDDPEAPRELKTKASIRELPLVGVALRAFTCFPNGFVRYHEKEETACITINKYLRENKLVPSPKHTLYSIRHTFEDRMKEAGIDGEMREIFFGHRRSRQEYGSGGSLEWRQSLLKRMELPFDPDILPAAASGVAPRGTSTGTGDAASAKPAGRRVKPGAQRQSSDARPAPAWRRNR